jgi:hypothetical protein
MSRRSCAAAVLLAVSLLGTGCAQEEPAARSTTGFEAAGPWAQEFADAVGSPYQDRILADGVVTAAERADAQQRTSACMRDHGYRYEQADDGTAEAEPLHDQIESIDTVSGFLRSCSARFDHDVSYLYDQVRRNPQKQDNATITVNCLHAAGLVGKDYTARMWRSEDETGKYSYDEWAAGAIQCRLDPLGLWRDR